MRAEHITGEVAEGSPHGRLWGVMDTANGLSIELRAEHSTNAPGSPISLRAVYANVGQRPLALTFWWNRSMRVVDAHDRVVPPGPGPVLPCGVREGVTRLAPGQRHERDEPLGCTQPAGSTETIGWSYDLAPGTYRVRLVFEFPPSHGRGEGHDPEAWRGRVESNEVAVAVPEPAPRPSLLARLASLWRSS
jgi:hypothetical protein